MNTLKALLLAANVNRSILIMLTLIVGFLTFEHFRAKGAFMPYFRPDPVINVTYVYDNMARTEPTPPVVQPADLSGVNAEIATLKADLNKAKEALARQRDMITLVAAMNNENFTALLRNDNDYLMIQSDWTVNRYPKHIDLNNDTREWWRKFVTTGSITDSATNKAIPMPSPSGSIFE